MNKFIGIRNVALTVLLIIVLLKFSMDFIPVRLHETVEYIQLGLGLVFLLVILPILIYRFNKGRADDATQTFNRKKKK
ncbi:hypothetical protein [Porphyromonas sp.]|uniref:hypothetical protein n=1 Tax=Porphyromonas sp. TaxID=1924944 RepID=UPI0026DCECE3|nr:hypothetical protein [Porphyromonas sp.]MDO4770644.1 hypothetical protein [Porphyromonas sp.]